MREPDSGPTFIQPLPFFIRNSLDIFSAHAYKSVFICLNEKTDFPLFAELDSEQGGKMRKRFSKWMVLAAVFTACTMSASGVMAECKIWDRIQKSGVLTVGTSPDYPPFESIDDAGNMVGFDIDLIKAVAKEMGLDVKLMSMGFDSIIIAVKNGQVNLGMSSFSVTDERKKSIDFTKPYYASGQVVLTTPKSGVKTVADLKGQAVAAQIGSTSAEAAKNIEGANALIVEDANIAVMMLKTGAVKAAVLDIAIADNYAAKSDFVQLEKPLSYEETAAVVRKGCPAFLDALNAAFEKVKASGQLDALRKKWGV